MIYSYTKFETISMGIVATEDKKSQDQVEDSKFLVRPIFSNLTPNENLSLIIFAEFPDWSSWQTPEKSR